MAPPRTKGHGTRACYRRGCRNPECVEANTIWIREYKQRTGRHKPRSEYLRRRHRHPSLNCYRKHRCRCLGCRALNTEDARRRAMLRAWR